MDGKNSLFIFSLKRTSGCLYLPLDQSILKNRPPVLTAIFHNDSLNLKLVSSNY